MISSRQHSSASSTPATSYCIRAASEKLASVDRVGVTGEKLFVLRTKDEHAISQEFLRVAASEP